MATLRHAAGLCWIAGFVDAVGYFHYGHVFTANMTGNTVLLGAAVVRADAIALTYAGTLAAFAGGVICAVLLKTRVRGLHVPFLFNASVLTALCLMAPSRLVVLLALAFAMGLQGGTISAFSGIRLPTVVVTSTLVNLIEGLVLRATPSMDQKDVPSGNQLRHLLIAWLTYGAGGAAAALAGSARLPLLLPACVYVVIAADLARRDRAGAP